MKTILFNQPIQKKKYAFYVKKFLNSNKSLHGPGEYSERIKKILIKRYKFKNILLTNSCTSALEIAALSIDIKKGDEVIVPSYSFITSASSFARCGAKIVYCDIDKHDLMPTLQQIKERITKKTKAIVIVHYQGKSINYLDILQNFCKKHKIYLIEDAAQALGSFFKKKALGLFGDFSCFSFHQTKNIHSGVGGLLLVNNNKFLNKANFIIDKGSDRQLVIQNKKKFFSWVTLGSSYILPELNCSYLLPQIIEYNKLINYRKKLYERYILNLFKYKKNYFNIIHNYDFQFNYHALVILLKNNSRDKLLQYLKRKSINAFIGYMPLHKSSYGKKYYQKKNLLQITDKVHSKIIRLPLHNYLKINDIDYICKEINNFFKKN
jgi:dTDP-4-amino-4,6-dideoxygalactose transaminase